MARGFNYAPGASAEVDEAKQPGLHKTHLMALGSSRNVLVRATVAAREDCPLGLMVTLAHDHSPEVRCAVARNTAAQRTVMAYLSADRSVDVVLALLENPHLPSDIVEELAFHKKGPVRSAAAARLDAGVADDDDAEDSHTPELADHVILGYPTAPIGARFPPAMPPAMPPVMPPGPAQVSLYAPAPDRVVPTRTAPVRGFTPIADD